jgi:protein SCO1/2
LQGRVFLYLVKENLRIAKPNATGGFEHQGYFALVDKNGYLRSRTDQFGNPIVYYLGVSEDEIEVQGTDMLVEDVRKLLENE